MEASVLMFTLKFNPDGTITVPASDLIALGSAVVHAQEFMSLGGNPVDKSAFDTMVQTAQPLLEALGKMALLPVRRDS